MIELIEVVGCIVLPTGQTKDLWALVDCGSTDNFINLDLVEKLKFKNLPLKNGCVSLGADIASQAAGETRPLTMTLGPSCSHKSRYTMIELGDHNIILGLIFLSHMAARVEGDDCWVPTRHGPVALPLSRLTSAPALPPPPISPWLHTLQSKTAWWSWAPLQFPPFQSSSSLGSSSSPGVLPYPSGSVPLSPQPAARHRPVDVPLGPPPGAPCCVPSQH